ncbi:uncharacterized protein LOC133188156 [Saccostrea echinata]|uniref:uncharacterized protein LOC133188156 n=1 Tax=Saccostrea echinata TaxID=191078 RepID=UPI002A820BF2|nr:uncharacterized protein LOC133188156 [Saccostrea echinata]
MSQIRIRLRDMDTAGPLQSVPVGSGYFEITCNVKLMNNRSEIRWTKDGQPFNIDPNNRDVYFSADRRKIIFENLSPEDNGIYTCHVNDPYVTSASTDLFIENPNDAMVVYMPQKKNPVVGSVLELRCDVTSSEPNVRLTWTKNGKRLTPSDRVTMERGNTLVTIRNITIADNGQYKCIANGDPSTAVSTFVNVHSRGKYIVLSCTGPREEKTITSGYFEIHCNLSLNSPGVSRITWLKDGETFILPSNRPVYFKNNKKTIVFTSVAPEDNGQYTCIVDNQYLASATTDLFIMNKENAVVVYEPETLNPLLGTRLELTCQITTTNPNIRLTWLRNGVPLEQTADGRVQFQNYNQLLVLDPVEMIDNGTYTCQANDRQRTSVSTVVNVHERDESRTVLTSMSLSSGSTFVKSNSLNEVNIRSGYFEINCLLDDDKSEVFWAKDGELFTPPSDRAIYFTNNKRKIVFEGLRSADSGLYTCVANNQHLSAASTDIFLESNMDNAMVVYVPRRYNPIVGRRLEIKCDTRSTNSNLKVTWFKENIPLNPRDNPNLSFLENGRKLVFNSVNIGDQGKYMCATDDPNIAALTMYIQPHANEAARQRYFGFLGGRPAVDSTVRVVSGVVSLQCDVANGATNIAWYKDGVPLDSSVPGASFEDDYQTLVLSQFGQSSEGNYMCLSEGPSWRSSSKELTYISPVEAGLTTKLMKMYPLFNSALEIKCGIPGLQPGDTITWEFEGRSIMPEPDRVMFLDDDRTLWISSFKPTDIGSYSCSANGFRWSVYANGYYTASQRNRALGNPIFLRPLMYGPQRQIRFGMPMRYPVMAGRVEIICGIRNNPNTVVRWLKDGRRIRRPQPTYYMYNGLVLVLMDFSASDNGIYTCVASDGTMSSSSTRLQFQNPEAATATYDPPKMNPVIGEKAEVLCNIPNLPPGVTLNWQKDGEPFDTPNERVKFYDNNRKIEFSSVYPEDAGTYVCIANDEIGTTYSTKVQVFSDDTLRQTSVYGNPTFLLSQNNRPLPNLNIGGSLELPIQSGTVELLCGVQSSNPNAVFTWLKDGQYLSRTPVYYKDDGRVLVIPNFTPADRGNYTCVTNDETMPSSSSILNYISPDLAEAKYESPHLNPLAGRKAVLICSIPNLPPRVDVFWEKNGQAFNTPNKRIKFLDNNRKIEFSEVYPQDAGSYTCRANDGSLMKYSTGIYVFDRDQDRRASVYGPYIEDWQPGSDIGQMTGQQPTAINPDIMLEQPTVVNPDVFGEQPTAVNPDTMGQRPVAINPDTVGEQPVLMNPNTVGEQPILINPDTVGEQPVLINPDTVGEQPVLINPDTVGEQPVLINPDTVGEQPVLINPDTVGEQPVFINPDTVGEQQVAPFPGASGEQPTSLYPGLTPPQSIIPQGQPMSLPIDAGRLYLRCGIRTNNPNTIIRWLKDGRPIQRNQPTYYMFNGRILVLMGFSASDSGQYTCVTNDRTMSSSSTSLQFENPGSATAVYGPPALNPLTGDKAEIVCNIPNLAQGVSVSWEKDGQPYDVPSTRVQFLDFNRRIVFSSVYPEDVGNYVCIANDEIGTTYSTNVNVFNDDTLRQTDVYGNPTFLLSQLDKPLPNLNIGGTLDLPLESGTAELLCGVQTSNPNAVFTWMKDGQPLTRTPVYYQDDGRVLVIPDFSPADDGKYTCIVNDRMMSTSSTDVRYINPGMASAAYNTPEKNAVINDKAEIYCNIPNLAPGVPVYWEKNGQPFDSPGPRVQFLNDNRKIEFSSVYPEDAGSYTCTLNDGSGRTYTDILTPHATNSERVDAVYGPNRPSEIPDLLSPQTILPIVPDQQNTINPDTLGEKPTAVYPDTGGEQPSSLYPGLTPPQSIIPQGQPMSLPIDAGRLYLRCGIRTNNPNTVIRWLKDGRPIQRNQPTYYMFNGRILVLMGFSASDSGQYTCVTNDRTMSSSSTSLQFENPGSATAVYGPPALNPLTGDKAEIVCNIPNLAPGVSVSWEKDGQPYDVPNTRVQFLDFNRRIVFSSVYPEDVGNYVCIANDEIGTTYSTNVNVFNDDTLRQTDVYGNPTFLLSQLDKPLPNLNIGGTLDLPLESGTAELLCGVQTSNPNAVFTWMKDGQPLTRTPVYYQDDGRVLVIPDFSPADDGKYTCIVNDRMMSTSSTDVRYMNPGMASAAYNTPEKNAVINDKAEIYCNIPNLAPGVPVYWEKNGQPFDSPGPRVQFLNDNRKIEFSSVYPEDAGSYTCTLNDGSGRTYTDILTPHVTNSERIDAVYGPNRPSEIPDTLSAETPQTIPPISAVDPNNVPDQQNVINPDTFGEQPTAIYPDTGGEQPSSIYPGLTPPQSIIPQGQPMSLPIDAGRLYLRCGIRTNNPNTVIRWLKNGRPIQRKQPTYYMFNGRILVLMGFSASDSGQYTCVTNDRTMSSSSTSLQFENPGSATAVYGPPALNPLTGDKAEIVCNIPNLAPGVSVSWEKDGQPYDVPNTRVQFLDFNRRIVFSSVYPEDVGNYVCIANDEIGTTYSTNVKVFDNDTLRQTDVYGNPTFLLSQLDKPLPNLNIGGTLDVPLESGTAELLCGVQTSNPNAVFTWMKDGQPLTRTPVYYQDDGRVLVIPDFSPADDGKYTCIVNDRMMSTSSTDVRYDNPGMVSVAYQTPERNAVIDHKAEIYCNIPNLAPGVPVYWEKNGQPFDSPSPRVQFLNDNRKIEFSSVYPEDAGSYTCTLNDGSGRTYTDILTPHATDLERKDAVYGPNRIGEIPDTLLAEPQQPTGMTPEPTETLPSDPSLTSDKINPDVVSGPSEIYPTDPNQPPESIIPGTAPTPSEIYPGDQNEQPAGINPDLVRAPLDVLPVDPAKPTETINPDVVPSPQDVYPMDPNQPPETMNPDMVPRPSDIYPTDIAQPPDARNVDIFPTPSDISPVDPNQPPGSINPDMVPGLPNVYPRDQNQPAEAINPDIVQRPSDLYPRDLNQPPADINPDKMPIPSDIYPRDPNQPSEGINPDLVPRPSDIYPRDQNQPLDATNPDMVPRQPDLFPRNQNQPLDTINPDILPRPTGIYPREPNQLPEDINPDIGPLVDTNPNDLNPNRQAPSPIATLPESGIPSRPRSFNFPMAAPPPPPPPDSGVTDTDQPQVDETLPRIPSARTDILPQAPQPLTVTANEGSPFALKCNTEWYPGDRITWNKNGQPIEFSSPNAPIVPGSPDNEGFIDPEQIEKAEGEVFTLKCKIPNIKETDSISWFKNNNPIMSSARRRLSSMGIAFNPLTMSDGGSYFCLRNNDLGSTYSADLTVLPTDSTPVSPVSSRQDPFPPPTDPEVRRPNAFVFEPRKPGMPSIPGGPTQPQTKSISPIPGPQTDPIPRIPGSRIDPVLPIPGSQIDPVPPIPGPQTDPFPPIPGSQIDPIPPIPGSRIDPVPPIPGSQIDPVPPIPGSQTDPFPPIPGSQIDPIPQNPRSQGSSILSDVEVSPGHFRPSEGTPFILECGGGINPDSAGTVRWIKDGRAVDKDVRQDRNGNLVFNPTILSDSGYYTCMSTNQRKVYNAAVDVLPENINDFLLSEKNKNPEDRLPMLEYYRPLSTSLFNLTCNITGADYRQPITWTKDGQPLDLSKPSMLQLGDRGRTLTFPSILPDQSGMYRCQIGQDDKAAIIDVRPESVQEYLLLSELNDRTPNAVLPNREQLPYLQLPNTENTPKLIVTDSGSSTLIPCDSGFNVDPNAPVSWYKDGVLLSSEPGVELRTEGLFLTNPMLSDTALYTCVLGDGEASSSTRLIVNEPRSYPETCEDSDGKVFPEGETYAPDLTKPCEVCTCSRGNPVNCNQMMCDAPPCPNYELIEGTCCGFRCLDTPGEPQPPFTPIEPEPPIRPPVNENPDRRLTESVSPFRGVPPLPPPPPPYFEEPDPDPMGINPMDALPATTDFKTRQPPQPRRISKTPYEEEISPGHFRPTERTMFNLKCRIPSANGRVIWMKDGRPLRNAIQQGVRGNLVFDSVRMRDSGIYTCLSDDYKHIYNAAVDVLPENINDFVLSERNTNPKDRLSTIDYHRPMSNTPFDLNCNIPGMDNRLPVMWKKDNRPLDLSKPMSLRITDRGRTLRFPSILRAQSGVYSCQIGDVDRTAIVDVRPEEVQEYLLLSELDDRTPNAILPNRDQLPALSLPSESDPKLVVAPSGAPTQIMCEAQQNMDPSLPVIWFRNGELVSQSPSLVFNPRGLLFTSVQAPDSGLYTCVVGEGEATSSTRLVVTSPDSVDPLQPSPIDPINRQVPPVPIDRSLPIDPLDRSVPPGLIDGPVPTSLIERQLPPEPTDGLNQISPYPKGSEPSLTDSQGPYTLPNLEIPRQIDNQLIGPEVPSDPDATTLLSQVNPDTGNLEPIQRPPDQPDINFLPPIAPVPPLDSTIRRADRLPTNVRPGPIGLSPEDTAPREMSPQRPFDGGRSEISSLGGIIEQFFYPRISQNFRLPCNVRGLTPRTPVVWYKDNRRFQPESGRVRIVGNAIVFQPALAEDSDSYVCVRPDTMQSVRAQLYVNGDEPPPGIRDERVSPRSDGSLVQHFYYPSSAELFELRCDLRSGDNRIPIRWFKNGRRFQIPDDRPVSLLNNNRVIRFSSISPRDNGQYTCIAGNNLATISSEIIVTSPGMTFNPRDRKISLSSSDKDALLQFTGTQGFSNKYFPIVRRPFILNCTAAIDTPSLPVSWLKNGVPFTPDRRRTFTQSNSIVFTSIMPDDSGHYTCIVGDNEDSENLIVDVIFHDMGSENNTPGRPILQRRYILTCGISNLRPNTQISWFKDGQPFIANSERVRFIDSRSSVLFTSLSEEDNGEYMCVANFGTSQASYTTTLRAAQERLHEIITVPVAPKEHRATLAERYVLICALPSVSTTNPPIWFKNRKPFNRRNARGNVSFRGNSLIFNTITEADQGVYTCSTPDGGDQYTTDLVVVPRMYTPTEGSMLTIRCQIPDVNPGRRVSWEKDGQPLPQMSSRTMTFSDDGRTITFTPVTPRNDGLYQCVSEDGRIYPLTIKVKPTMLFPQSKTSFVLDCALQNMNSRRMVVWLKDGEVFRPNLDRISFNVADGVRQIVFDPLLPEDSGRYTCVGPDRDRYMVNVIVDGRTAARRNVQPTITQAFRLTCDIPFLDSSTPVYWLKGQQLFTPPREDVKFEDGNNVIVFESVMPEDYGKYTCVTADGGEYYTVNMDVKSGPGHRRVTIGVTDRPVSTIPARTTYKLFCRIPNLEPTEKVVWLKNEQVFLPSGSRIRFSPRGRVVTFSTLLEQDSGMYSCVSELSGTTISQILDVGKPIYPDDYKLEVSPDYYRPVETKPFILQCRLPYSSGRVFWMKNGSLFNPQQSPSISQNDRLRRLEFENIMPGDSGLYVCLSEDHNGIYSAGVDVLPYNIYEYISSLGPPDRQGSLPGSELPGNLDYVRIPAGVAYNLLCNITNSPGPKAWSKDGVILRPSAPGDTNRFLSFDSITKADSGVYTCQSGNQEYTVLVDVVPRNVQEYFLLSERPDEKPSLRLPDAMPEKPRLSLPNSIDQKLRYTRPGQPFAIICDIPPQNQPVRWYRDGLLYTPNRPDVQVFDRMIQFGQVTENDQGVYSCVAGDGDAISSTRLIVNPRHTTVTVNVAERENPETYAFTRFQLTCNIPLLNPEEQVAWMKGNQLFIPPVDRNIQFSPNGRTITFDPILQEDSGTYTCISERTGAQVSQLVKVNPPIYPDYYREEVSPGYHRPVETKPFILRCPGAGAPVTWIKDGLPLTKNQQRISFSSGDRQIIFNSVRREDSGYYVCIAMNGRILHLSAVDVVPLSVYDYLMALGPPERQGNQLLNLPSNLNYLRPLSGDMLEIFCNVSNSALTQPISWTKDGTLLPDQNSQFLLFPSVTEEDGGLYTCMAGNEEYNALVDVKPRNVQEYLLLSDTQDKKPTLLLPDAAEEKPLLSLPLDARERLRIQTRPPGVGYVLVCNLPSYIPYQAPIRWYKNGEAYNIPPNSRRVSVIDNGRVLRFESLREEDSGLYTCVAGNNLALYASRIIVAPDVRNEQLTIGVRNRENNVQVNQDFTLICGITPMNPNMPVVWLKNGRAFSSFDPSRVMVMGRNITFSPVLPVDQGRYTCMAIDNSASFTSVLNVLARGARAEDSQLLNIWQQQFTPLGLGAYELTCVMPPTVDPSVPVIWMKNGRRMTRDDTGRISYTDGNRRMIFSELSPEDRGWYTCVALDNSASYTLSLVVDLDRNTETDTVGTALRVNNRLLGMEYELRCLLPDPEKPVFWIKNGEPFGADQAGRISFFDRNHVVRFSSLRPEDNGYYMCRYEDGSMTYSTAIRVVGGPSGAGLRNIRNFYLMQLGGKFELRCAIQAMNPNFRVIWLKNGQLYDPPASRAISFTNGNSRIIFDDLREDDAGFYTCISGGNRYSTRLYMKKPVIQGGTGCIAQCGTTASSCTIQLNCTKYMTCEVNGETCDCRTMMCQFGTFWNPDAMRCTSIRSTTCGTDPCLFHPPRYTYPSEYNCRSFYRCSNNRKSIPMCCRAFFKYDHRTGSCQPDNGCSIECTKRQIIAADPTVKLMTVRPPGGVCFLEPIPDDPGRYYNRASGTTEPCPPATVFRAESCVCENSLTLTHVHEKTSALIRECHPLLQLSFEKGIRNISPHAVYTEITDVNTTVSRRPKVSVGTFNGRTSEISTPRFVRDEIEELFVTLNFLEKDGSDHQVLFSNCRALATPYKVPGIPGLRTSSAEILLDKRKQEIIFIGKTDDPRINTAIVRVPYTPNQWNKVELMFDGYRLRGVVTTDKNGVPVRQFAVEPLVGRLIPSEDMTSLGRCSDKDAFRGFMDKVIVSNCIPKG